MLLTPFRTSVTDKRAIATGRFGVIWEPMDTVGIEVTRKLFGPCPTW